MIWVAWRLQRLETLIAAGMLVLAGLLLRATGLELAALYQRTGMATCIALHLHSDACDGALQDFSNQIEPLSNTSLSIVKILPVLCALLLCAPFVAELEQGTFRLAWTQSITRARWLAFRLGLMLAGALLCALALTLPAAWWQRPLVQTVGPFDARVFDLGGAVPIAYTLFAVALCLALGVLLRRVVPTVGLTLAGFLALRFAIAGWARPRFLPPIARAWTSGPIPVAPHDWVIDRGNTWRDSLGHPLSYDQVQALCGLPDPTLSPAAVKDYYVACYNHYGLAEIVRYQPADRFWLFQGIESAIYLGLAAGLLALTVWWVRYRLA